MIANLIGGVRHGPWFTDDFTDGHHLAQSNLGPEIAAWASGHIVALLLIGVAVLLFTYGSSGKTSNSVPKRAATGVSLVSLLFALVQIFGHNVADIGDWLLRLWPFH